jgi:transposase InsO family protein
MDFVSDALFDGRRIRALTVVDDYSRESLAIEVGQSITGEQVVAVMNRIVAERGAPQRIRVDNSPEFVSRALDQRAYLHQVTLDFSRPGKPTDNALVESFNGRLRLIRDRDGAFGPAYTHRSRAMGIRDHPTAPRSPWQNGHAERLIGSIRRECLDHLLVFDEAQLRRVLKDYEDYASYYNQVRTHLSLDRNAPDFRRPQKIGRIAALPILGGLHHQYVRVQVLTRDRSFDQAQPPLGPTIK